MTAAALAPALPPLLQRPLRVMVVDDAIVVRGLIARWLQEQPDFEVGAVLRTGAEAVSQFDAVQPDVVILDVEMPDMDGLAALPLLLAKKPDLVVIMASTATRRNAEVSLKALSLGAADYIAKPETLRGITVSAEFRGELVEKVRALGRARRTRASAPAAGMTGIGAPGILRPLPLDATAAGGSGDYSLRPFGSRIPRALLIGASTGGPQALATLLGGLGTLPDRVPVLVVQHMPRTFTTILAEHLSATTGRVVREPQDGEPVAAGTIYVAPGGLHMRLVRNDGQVAIRLDDSAPINFCKPAVDPLFASASAAWSGAVLAVLLTGMGGDGTRGAQEIVAAGGSVIAQDEATSVVWGMPGSAAHAGLCAAVLPLDAIAPNIVRQFPGDVA
jgi:two-component system chemotaxis response regulator CheB